jgi:hypothetical protein
VGESSCRFESLFTAASCATRFSDIAHLQESGRLADIPTMGRRLVIKMAVRCAYLKSCYLAEALECYGFRTDCPLYMKTNDEPCNEARFHAAMDRLIIKTREKHERLKRFATGETVTPERSDKTLAE